MPARWLQAKTIKLKKQRRAWARPLSVKSGIQPNRDVIKQYQETAKGLGKLIAEVRFPNVAPGRKEIMDRLKDDDFLREIIYDIKDPFFVNIVDNARHRCRLYFNSGMSCFILQYMQWDKGRAKISISYPSSTRALEVWNTENVIWKKEYSIRRR
jgi:hypothetical protein